MAKVNFDYRGYLTTECTVGKPVRRIPLDYVWIGDDKECYTHVTNLKAIRAMHAALGALIRRRVAINRKKRRLKP